jgi:dimethylargininase
MEQDKTYVSLQIFQNEWTEFSTVCERCPIIAITRPVSPTINECELTHLLRAEIDVELAQTQHRNYEKALVALGCDLRPLAPSPNLPDAVFVEDTALVLDEIAVITRPGAASRRAERDSVAAALAQYRDLGRIDAPGTVDGGDILRLGRTIFVGQSKRSNRAGFEQLASQLKPFGYTVHAVNVRSCLHLKSAVTQVGPEMLLINKDWVEPGTFESFRLIEVAPQEPFGANALWLGDTVIYPAEYTATRQILENSGLVVKPVDVSELTKAEGGVTCCSLIID